MFANEQPFSQFPIRVAFDPFWNDIHRVFSPLINLSHASFPTPPPSDEEDVIALTSSPISSPVFQAEQETLNRLLKPVEVEECLSGAGADADRHEFFINEVRAKEEREKEYIAFIFAEYKKRKSIEQKYDTVMADLRRQLEVARQEDLPPYVRNLLEGIQENEALQRADVENAYGAFVKWVYEMIPQWLDAVHEQEAETQRQIEAKEAALAAAKDALTLELTQGRILQEGIASVPYIDGPSLPPNPYSSEYALPNEELSPTALREKAIRMLEMEEIEMKKRQSDQLQLLREQEEMLKAQIEKKEREKEQQLSQQREEEMAKKYDELLQQESAIAARVRQREEQEKQKEEEKQMLLEHIRAEEELLRKKLKEKEEKEKAIKEENDRLEKKKKEAMYEELRREEEALRSRIAEKERAKELAAQEAQSREAMKKEQDRILQEARESREREERQRQLQFLMEKEREYKSELLRKEMADIQARERSRLPTTTYYSPPPHQAGYYADPNVYTVPTQPPYGYPTGPPLPAPPMVYPYPAPDHHSPHPYSQPLLPPSWGQPGFASQPTRGYY